nr:hypothetical protein [Candidatus Sigynarchaeota archaeon]
MNMNIEDVEEVLKRYSADTKTAQKLVSILNSINPLGNEVEIDSLRRSILKLEDLERVKSELEKLKKNADISKEKDDARLNALGDEIAKIRAQGFNVPHLVMLHEARNLVVLDEAMKRFRSFELKLNDLEKRMDALTKHGFDIEVNTLRPYMKDQAHIDFIEQGVLKLEEDLRQDEKRKVLFSGYESKMNDWELCGFDTTALKKVFVSDPMMVATAFTDFEKKVNQMAHLKVNLESLRGEGFDPDIDMVMERTRDVNNIFMVTNSIRSLKDLIEKKKVENAHRLELNVKMKLWKTQGWDTSSLESVIGSDIETLDAEFADYTQKKEYVEQWLEY